MNVCIGIHAYVVPMEIHVIYVCACEVCVCVWLVLAFYANHKKPGAQRQLEAMYTYKVLMFNECNQTKIRIRAMYMILSSDVHNLCSQ